MDMIDDTIKKIMFHTLPIKPSGERTDFPVG